MLPVVYIDCLVSSRWGLVCTYAANGSYVRTHGSFLCGYDVLILQQIAGDLLYTLSYSHNNTAFCEPIVRTGCKSVPHRKGVNN